MPPAPLQPIIETSPSRAHQWALYQRRNIETQQKLRGEIPTTPPPPLLFQVGVTLCPRGKGIITTYFW